MGGKESEEAMTVKTWEKRVLSRPRARERVEELEHELLVAHGAAERLDVSSQDADRHVL